MAYDAANGTVVLFGGQTTSRALNDTWTWDGSGWTQAHPATSPPPMASAQMTYDPVTHDVLLVGAQQVEGSNHAPIACWGGSGSLLGFLGLRLVTLGDDLDPAGRRSPRRHPGADCLGRPAGQPMPTAPPGCGTIFSPNACDMVVERQRLVEGLGVDTVRRVRERQPGNRPGVGTGGAPHQGTLRGAGPRGCADRDRLPDADRGHP